MILPALRNYIKSLVEQRERTSKVAPKPAKPFTPEELGRFNSMLRLLDAGWNFDGESEDGVVTLWRWPDSGMFRKKRYTTVSLPQGYADPIVTLIQHGYTPAVDTISGLIVLMKDSRVVLHIHNDKLDVFATQTDMDEIDLIWKGMA